ncbi:hypothetical protein SPRG_11821 [Saprolegnia parasitica CBS 223.65]|uniref:Uncharacterized protein n=1 Tax=Saprolegnia parasitica (strain CBS 223.65) TaxID=695850 RepID=A0A067BWQ1_SAPPC|nr:hypothetical protein SPRG_11821 [Saprolegnia parasitica CBS 223.65]KDO22974.1 hypothetical protein SPRG_11821 [Saprolegnia parasitica CBS 223.65]|eukprot:XP_012206265.1 hypothetical protein SPRG_11821 [Saprolegnia parasitica CBS 223.65]
MDVQEMLEMVQVNHQAALDALAAQVKTLRETVQLQQLELQQQREAHEQAVATLENDATNLRQLLEQTQAENQELSATVHLLNDELNVKSTAKRHSPTPSEPNMPVPPSYEMEAPAYDNSAASHTSMDTSMDFSYPALWDQPQETMAAPLHVYNLYQNDRLSRPAKLASFKEPATHDSNSRLEHELRRLREKLGACSTAL